LRILLIAMAVLCVTAGHSAAQTDSGCLAEAAEKLEKNQLITVVGQDSSITVGLLQSVDLSRNFLTLDVRVGSDQSAAFRTVNYELMNISMITAQEGKGMGAQTWIGALIGAGLGIAAGAVMGADGPGTYVPGLLIGTAFGGWVGYEIQPDPPPLIIDCK
jgi:hypothetical protein